jgi:hypothetical protein
MTRRENSEYAIREAVGILLFFLFSIPALSQAPCQPTGSGVCWYVSTTGNDSNTGNTRAAPKRNIEQTVNGAGPGDEIIVLNGTYNCTNQSPNQDSCVGDPSSVLIRLVANGTVANPIVITCDTYLGCLIDGMMNPANTNASTDEAFVGRPGGNYVTIENFEIANFIDKAFENCCTLAGTHVVLTRNWIHDIGRYCTTTGIGRDGVYFNYGPATVTDNIFSDIGRYAVGEQGCTASLPQNDHCVYISGQYGVISDVLVANNIFYRNERGGCVQIYPSGANNISILNNTFINADLQSGSSQGQIIVSTCGTSPGCTNINIENNISYQPGNHFVWLSTNAETVTGTIANNVVYGTSNVTSPNPGGVNFTITGNIFADPKLMNVGNTTMDTAPTTPDAHLQAGSPAVGAGLTLAMVPGDFAGTARIPGAYDIGTYAYSLAPTIAPPTNLQVVVH